MKRAIWLGAAAMMVMPSAGPAQTPANPFAQESTLPFHAPPFDRIRETDYRPAFEAAMAEQRAEIDRIASNPAAPTFDNTMVAMERSGRMLDRVQRAFGGVVQANTNPVLDATRAAMAPKLAAHEDAIHLDPRLFARVQAVYDRRATLTGPEQRQLTEVVYQEFVRAGARLGTADQARLRDLNGQLSSAQTAFGQKLVAAAKAGALVVDDRAALAGLDEAGIAAATQAAADRKLPGKYVLPLQNTTQQPLLASLDNRATREALFNRAWTRAEQGDANDTRALILQIVRLRAEKARLLGFPSWADYVLGNQMAKTPQAALAFMAQLAPVTAAEEKREVAELQAEITRSGANFELKPWDWEYYSQRVRKAKYDLDQNEVKPYFEISTVLTQGVFYAANQLYGVRFVERHDIPAYHPDVRVFTVYDKDGSELGLMYFDYWKRDNKSGGAWMSNFVGQSKLLGTKPVVYNVANFTKPAPGNPALITFEDVTTMFHEFGHALHGLFAAQMYPTLSGTATARDWVEFPSQFNEHWALDPQVFAHYARHYQTGAAMPAPLVDKIKRASKFSSGYLLGELIAAARLDMSWHSLPADAQVADVDAFETQALAQTGLDVADVPPRYRSSYFQHIFAGGYAAGYYAYLWTQMLDNDAWAWFQSHGGLTRANGQRFRDIILSKGHTEDYAPMFRAFYGKEPDIAPMLEDRGLATPR